MNDAFSSYIQAMNHLCEYLKEHSKNQKIITSAELLQMRLEREIYEVQRFGGEPRDAQLNRILDDILTFSQESTGKLFSYWRDIARNAHTPLEFSSPARYENVPDTPLLTPSEAPEQTSEGPTLLPLPIQIYTQEMFALLQKAQPLVEQDRVVYPFELASIRQRLQQSNQGISPEIIASIEPITLAHAALVVAVNHIKKCTEEITELFSRLEDTYQKPIGKKHRQHLQEKLAMTVFYMQQYPNLVS